VEGDVAVLERSFQGASGEGPMFIGAD
jgi:hypothetical protein